MSVIDSTSEATAVGVGSKNVQFGISGGNVTRKIAAIAVFDPLITTTIAEVPLQVLNEADAGARAGQGFPLHRLIKRIFEGSEGAGEVWMIPQAEGTTVAAGEIDTAVGPATEAGNFYIRISGELYKVPVLNAATKEEATTAAVAFINLVADCPVVASQTLATFELVLTAKAKGLEGDLITITVNSGEDESTPAGLSPLVITAMTAGAGTPDIDDALAAMGVAGSDEANQKNFTHLSHGYGIDTGTIDKISVYVGEGNDFVGLYSKLIGRPFMSLTGDNTKDTAGLTALRAISDARLNDRANGILAAPDSDWNPVEIAARATGIMARISQANPAQHFAGKILSGVGAGATANRWTADYSVRDSAVKGGISPTRVISEEVFLQNIITFYRPTSVPASSNGYKSMRSLAIIQDVLFKLRETFEAEAWQGITIVDDKSIITDFEARQTARDLLDVRTTVNNLADFFASKAWLFNATFAKENSIVLIRAASNGFDINFKWKMSGESQVYNIQSSFDTNIT